MKNKFIKKKKVKKYLRIIKSSNKQNKNLNLQHKLLIESNGFNYNHLFLT